MATKLQRVLLWHMKEHGETAVIATGHKSSNWGTLKDGRAYIECSQCVLWGLVSNKFVTKCDPVDGASGLPLANQTWRLTILGFNISGLQKPQIKAHFTGGKHGPRWK